MGIEERLKKKKNILYCQFQIKSSLKGKERMTKVSPLIGLEISLATNVTQVEASKLKSLEEFEGGGES